MNNLWQKIHKKDKIGKKDFRPDME